MRAHCLATSVLLLTTAACAYAEAPALFLPGDAAAPQARSAGATRARTARLDLAALRALPTDGSGRLTFNLFDDTTAVARFARLDTVMTRSHAWTGPLDDEPLGTFTLTSSPTGTLAVIRSARRGTFVVRADAAGNATIEQVDPAGPRCFPGQHQHAALGKAAAKATAAAVPLPQAAPNTFGCDDGTVIDIMIVYTAQARVAAGGTSAMHDRIDFAIADTNAAFTRSQIDTQLRLVHRYETTYTETGDYQIDTARFEDPADGFLDDIPVQRDLHGADCVSLWFDTYNNIGYGYYPHPSLQGIGASGLTLMDWRGYEGLLLAHEVGHNLWCSHDRNNHSGPSYSDYSFGYREPGNAWRTIMAYAPGVLIPYFANPNVNWPGPNPPNPGPTGVPAGQPNACDIALTITQTRHIVANFRPTVVPGLPPIIYVRANAPPGGDGLSWATAFNDLQDALCRAGGSQGAVTQIWVAGGTYKPDRGTGDRSASFHLQENLAIYGGFAGTETLLTQRDVAANPTILSGEIGAPGIADNSYHVVQAISVDQTARLDGFTITGGNADGAFSDYAGAGLRLESAAPVIANCTITGNQAEVGGGAHNLLDAAPTWINCTFSSNNADFGGAVHNYQSRATFSDCTFQNNSAGFGGGVLSEESDTMLIGCTFTGNQATQGGGGMDNSFGSVATVTNCNFTGNSAQFGAGVYNYQDSDGQFTCCTFTTNQAPVGGAMHNYASSPRIEGCTFSQNSAAPQGGGGAIWNESSAAVIRSCLFHQNTADVLGGALANSDSPAVIRECTFTENTSGFGGAVSNGGVMVHFVNCRFLGNSATSGGGGAVANSTGPAGFVNCLFSGNTSLFDGGALIDYTDLGQTVLINCTISRNRSTNSLGGGVSMAAGGMSLTNCILWGNIDVNGSIQGSQVWAWTGAPTINYSIVQGWTGSLGGTANNGSDPNFLDPDGNDNIVGTPDDDCRVPAGSPAVDTGNTAALPADIADLDDDGNTAEPVALDLDRRPRVLNGTVDRGALELPPVIAPDFDQDGDVDEDDLAHLMNCATRATIAQNEPSCASARLDGDTDVDMDDFGIFQRCYSGKHNPADPACINP